MRNIKNINIILLSVALLVLAGCELPHSISGTVIINTSVVVSEGDNGTSTSGDAGLSGAVVTAVQGGTTKKATTDSQGNYTIVDLDIGSYTVSVAKEGFTFEPSSTDVTIGTTDAEGTEESDNIDEGGKIHIEDIDFAATKTDTGDDAHLYYFDESDDSVLYSDYYFAYNDAGDIETISRDIGKDGSIDTVDYYTYDQYELLTAIDRDLDGDRATDIIYTFVYDELDDAETAFSAAEIGVQVAKFNSARMTKNASDARTAATSAGSASDYSDVYDSVTEVDELATEVASVASSMTTPAQTAAEKAITDAETAYDIEALALAQEQLDSAEADHEIVTDAEAFLEELALALKALNTDITDGDDNATAESAANAIAAAETAADDAEELAEWAAGNITTANAAVTTAQTALDEISQQSSGTQNDLEATLDRTIQYGYDDDGNLISEEDVESDVVDSSVHYTFDDNGTLLTAEFNDDEDNIIDGISSYYYDADGKITTVERDDNADGVVESLYSFYYDANNNISKIDRDDGNDGVVDAVATYLYDREERLETIKQDDSYPQVIGNSITFFNIEMF